MAEILTFPADLDLSGRIRRLEDEVAVLKAGAVAPLAEEQVADRVLSILAERAAQHRGGNGSPGPAGLLPAAFRTVYPLADDAPPGATNLPPDLGLRTWLLTHVVGELRLMTRLYFDPRYRLSRLSQFGIPVVLGLFVLNYLLFSIFFPVIPILSPIGERVVGIFLAVALYKLLAREVVRYKQVLDYLAQYGYR